jgi:hypothetical protein
MRMFAAAAVIGIVIASLAGAQDHEQCHKASAHDRRAAVDHRHHAATGVGDDVSQHIFSLAKDGGTIRLEVRDAAATGERERIREHLRGIARAFARGDFAMPARIHDRTPPGVEVMTARRSAIHYAYAPTDKGGQVTISTADAAAREAIHQFLRFQIADHGTGAPSE